MSKKLADKNSCSQDETCNECHECRKLPIAFYPKPNRNTECCRCGRKYSELKKLGIGLEEMKDVVGGDDWNWWCDDCYIEMVGKECEICHDITTRSIKCSKCKTILCSVCVKGHNCGIFGWRRIKKLLFIDVHHRIKERV